MVWLDIFKKDAEQIRDGKNVKMVDLELKSSHLMRRDICMLIKPTLV